ncbi:MAG: C1 family peptidase [bacterium]
MRLAGHTPLSKAGADKISPQHETLLSSLWVESVEEFAAMMAAIESADESPEPPTVNPLRQTASALLKDIPDEALVPWQTATAGGPLGCALNPEVLDLFRKRGRLVEPGAVLPQLSERPLPPSVRLMEELFPVRDQGERGTCVAFASVGLREYLDKCLRALSEQFLYWACKQLDGLPDTPGTYLHTAMSVLGTQGVCSEEACPYNPEVIPGDEAQERPSPEAFEEAREYIMSNTRPVAANCVNHYKQMLAGDEDVIGMPVAIVSLVFNSWYRSAATHQSGKITLPLPGEEPLPGGHAMLIVGYQDDSSVPGGGYFIVRNSWSAEWAAQSPEAPGHGMMPYAYVERCVVEAFTGEKAGAKTNAPEKEPSVAVSAGSSDSFEQYLDTLRRPMRDVDGKLLQAGTRVIRHPEAREDVMEDNPGNRRQFADGGFTWRDLTQLPPPSQWDRQLRKAVEDARNRCDQFGAALKDNLKASVGEPLPDIHLPFWVYALPFLPRVRGVQEIADLSRRLSDEVCRLGHLGEETSVPEDWSRTLAAMNLMKVYAVSGFLGTFHVVAAFAAPFEFSRYENPEPALATADLVSTVHRLYNDWASETPAPRLTFFSIGSATPWADGVTGFTGGKRWTVLSAPDEDTGWQTSTPPQFAVRRYLRDFTERLRPETEQESVSRIKSAVDRLIEEGYRGNIRLEKVARETGYRRTVVRNALRAMQESGHYECYRVDKQIAVRRRTGEGGIRLHSEPSVLLRYHIGMIVAGLLGPLGWVLASYHVTGVFRWQTLLWVIPFGCAARCVENVIGRIQVDL